MAGANNGKSGVDWAKLGAKPKGWRAPVEEEVDKEADINQRRREENEANTPPRRPSLEAVHGSPPRVLSGNETNEEKRYDDAIREAAITRKRQDNKLAKEEVNLRADRAARSHHLPRNKSREDDANVNKARSTSRKTPEMAAVAEAVRQNAIKLLRAEAKSFTKPHHEDISTTRPRVSTRHFTERAEEEDSPLSLSRKACHDTPMYPSPTTTSDDSEVGIMTMEKTKPECKQGKQPPYDATPTKQARGRGKHRTHAASMRPTSDLPTSTGRGRGNSQRHPGPSMTPTAPTGGRAFHRGNVKGGTQRGTIQSQLSTSSSSGEDKNDGSDKAVNKGSTTRAAGKSFTRGRREKGVSLHTQLMSGDEKLE